MYGILLEIAAPSVISSAYSMSSPIAIPLAIDEILTLYFSKTFNK